MIKTVIFEHSTLSSLLSSMYTYGYTDLRAFVHPHHFKREWWWWRVVIHSISIRLFISARSCWESLIFARVGIGIQNDHVMCEEKRIHFKHCYAASLCTECKMNFCDRQIISMAFPTSEATLMRFFILKHYQWRYQKQNGYLIMKMKLDRFPGGRRDSFDAVMPLVNDTFCFPLVCISNCD